MRLVMIALAASVAFGQNSRVFQLTRDETRQEMQEIANALRGIAGILQAAIDDTKRTVTVDGTAGQIAVAEWLVQQLDRGSGAREYRPPASSDDVVRVFELTHPRTSPQLQEIATLVRSIGDIQRLFIYTERRVLALRATAEQVELAAWLVRELDQPRAPIRNPSERHEYRLSSGPDNLVRVFYLTGDYQKAATQVRANARIPRLFVYNALGALAARGTVWAGGYSGEGARGDEGAVAAV